MVKTSTPPNSGVYYSSIYWNDFPRVLAYICEACTGDPGKWWIEGFKDRYCKAGPFRHGLFLNCGNGWVERDFVDRGIVCMATAFDYSIDLLREARRLRDDRPIGYFRADVNLVDFEPGSFDLVVNVGAIHHVQYVNRLFRVLCMAMTADAVLVNYDYVGPARNQYSSAHWRLIEQANASLPPTVRKDPIRRAHLPTMLHDDPTEAIHSDLTLGTLERHFELVERRDVGGGIAYEILTHNGKAHALPAEELDPHLDRLLAMDREQTRSGRVPTLFSYFVARPKKSSLTDSRLVVHQEVEDRRESLAARRRGAYNLRDYVSMVVHEQGVRLSLRRRRLGRHARAIRARLGRLGARSTRR
jgi:SAM-dependent methyltransferase